MSLTNNFDKLKKEKSGEPQTQSHASEDIETYASAGNVRNLCFIQPNGESLFLNYAYLISGEFKPQDNSIVLSYTTHTITLKGHNLGLLIDEFMAQNLRKIRCMDERYSATKDKADTFVTSILAVSTQG